MIDVRELSFGYPKGKGRALKGISFGVSAGEIFGFLGPSGAGKSTAQKILTGLLKGYEGGAAVMGKALKDWGADYYERIGVSFELPNHYLKLTGLENLEYFRSLYSVETEEPRDLLTRLGLADAAKLPVAGYSKGMQMRLTFARALLHRPRLLFLDEPTSGLDPANARLIRDIILEKREDGATVFLTTHNMTIADELCDRVAFLDDGEIKEIGAPKELRLKYGKRTLRVEFGENGDLKRCDFPLDGLGDNPQFLRLLREERIHTIHSQETTLEEVFFKVTGRALG